MKGGALQISSKTENNDILREQLEDLNQEYCLLQDRLDHISVEKDRYEKMIDVLLDVIVYQKEKYELPF